MEFLGLVQLLLLAAAASGALVKRQDSETTAIVYKQFLVDSLVVSRYAVTSITSVVRNEDLQQSKELEFRVQLPETAFISNFSMLDPPLHRAWLVQLRSVFLQVSEREDVLWHREGEGRG